MYHPLNHETHLLFDESRIKLGSGSQGEVYKVRHNHQIITEKYKALGKFKVLAPFFRSPSHDVAALQVCNLNYLSHNIIEIFPTNTQDSVSQVLPDSPNVKSFLSNLQRFWYEVYCMKELTLAQRMQVPGSNFFNPIYEHVYGFDANGVVYGIIRAPLIENEQNEVQSCASFARKFQPHLMAHIALQTLNALHVTHDLEITLRDLKPEHLLIAGDEIRIIDLGLARTVRGKESFDNTFIPQHPLPDKGRGLIHHSKLTLPKGVQDFMTDYPSELILGGTIHYMPISSLAGKIDREADIWAWLVSMYETASGVYPFPKIIEVCDDPSASMETQMKNALHTIRTIRQDELEVQFRKANPLVPASFYTPLCACLKEPNPERIALFTHLLQDLTVEKTPDVAVEKTSAAHAPDTAAMSIVDLAAIMKYQK